MSSKLQADASAETTIMGFLRRQRVAQKPLPPHVSAKGQTVIVTGSNIGLGLATCRQLLQLGLSHLVMAVRTQAKGDAAASQLREEFPDAQVSVWTLEMDSYDSIRAFAARCESSLPRIDAVILNAGLAKPTFTVSEDTGHEVTLQVNYLSTAFLALLLVPVLKAKKIPAGGGPPVLSIVGSDTSYMTSIETEGPVMAKLDKPEHFATMANYSATKLLLLFFVDRLAELVDPADVIINVSNPGLTTGTELMRSDEPLIPRIIRGAMMSLLARPLNVGASIYLWAIYDQNSESHGSFISDWTIKPFPPICYTDEGKQLRARLWEETMKELEPAGATPPSK